MKYRSLSALTPVAVIGMITPVAVDFVARGDELSVPIIAAALIELVCVLTWTFFAARNPHALGVKGMRFTPFTAIAWYVIPLANIYMPYRALAEAWRASDPERFRDGTTWRDTPGPHALLAWWVLSILSIVSMSPDRTWQLIGYGLTAGAVACFIYGAVALAKRQADCAGKAA